jgi:hypothetical protein
VYRSGIPKRCVVSWIITGAPKPDTSVYSPRRRPIETPKRIVVPSTVMPSSGRAPTYAIESTTARRDATT